VVVSGVDEEGVDAPDTPTLVTTLAQRKASAVADPAGRSVVVGCDSLLEFGGVPHGKPGSADEARAWLRAMRGRSGTLYTGHCVIDEPTARQATGVAATTVRFGVTTDAELDAYLATGEALAVAGAFTLDGRSAPFIDGVDGDPGNVIGLSLPLLRALLAGLGIPITDLWAGTPAGTVSAGTVPA
jgi:septum formation protein